MFMKTKPKKKAKLMTYIFALGYILGGRKSKRNKKKR